MITIALLAMAMAETECSAVILARIDISRDPP